MAPLTTLLIASASIALIGATASMKSSEPTAAATTVAATTQQSATALNAPYNAFLAKYIRSVDGINLVAYGSVTAADKASLKAYVSALEKLRPSTMSQNEELAYWFNLYNAKTVEIILDNYPVRSIRQIGGGLIAKGPWKMDVLTIEGEAYSLDNIEHDTVREKFDEPRVHYAFNCASLGCPNLATTAWTAANLDARLDQAARDFIAHPRGVRIESNGKVVASNIYKWFQKDFGRNDRDVLAHLRQYATGAKLEALNGVNRINSYEYDWNLNEPK